MNIVNYINFQVEEEQKNELLTVKGGCSNVSGRFDGNWRREGESAAGEQAAGFDKSAQEILTISKIKYGLRVS